MKQRMISFPLNTHNLTYMILEKKNSWKNSKIAGHIGAMITVICWGCSFIASKLRNLSERERRRKR